MLSDDQIIRRSLKGDGNAFRELVKRHERAAFRLACRMLKRREDAEDAVQESCLRAYQSLSTYSGDNKFGAWLRRIVVNCCLRRLQGDREIPAEGVEDAIDAEQPLTNQVELEVLRKLAQEDIRGAIESLPDSYRTVVVLRYHEDLSCVEIADILSESPGAIRVRLHRAHKVLAERLAVVRDEM